MALVHVVAGGQFGSEGKGQIAGFICNQLAIKDLNTICVRVGGPNAGHTVYSIRDQKEWKFRHVPVAAVTHPTCHLHLGPGSEVDFAVLKEEIDLLEKDGYSIRDRISVSPHATVLKPEYIEEERLDFSLKEHGSTHKGIGKARVERLHRTALTVKDDTFHSRECGVIVWEPDYHAFDRIVIEGTQGYGLGLHTKYYPYTTSGDARASDFLCQANICPWDSHHKIQVTLVFRTYPIRIAGNSGPLHGETSFEDLGLDPEFTTVTKKKRRIGTWDPDLVETAIKDNCPHYIALNFCDYVNPELHMETNTEKIYNGIDTKYRIMSGHSNAIFGTGKNSVACTDWVKSHL